MISFFIGLKFYVEGKFFLLQLHIALLTEYYLFCTFESGAQETMASLSDLGKNPVFCVSIKTNNLLFKRTFLLLNKTNIYIYRNSNSAAEGFSHR